MRKSRILFILGIAAVALSGCGLGRTPDLPIPDVVHRSGGMLGERIVNFRPMPTGLKLKGLSPSEQQAFVNVYESSLKACQQANYNHGVDAKMEAAAGAVGFGSAGALGGFAAYSLYPPADPGVGAGIGGVTGAINGGYSGGDAGVREEKWNITQCINHDISQYGGTVLAYTGDSGWDWPEVFGHPIGQASYQLPPANYQYQPPQSDYRQPQSDASPPPPTNQHTSSSFSGSNDEYCNYLKMRGMVCKD